MHILYTVLMTLCLPFAFLRLWLKGFRHPGYREHWPERLGYVPFRCEGVIWIHVVSLGESIAATPLIKALVARYPGKILVTNTTPTGRAYVKKTFGDAVHHTYFPYDVPLCLGRFLRATKPRVLLLMETELWPNLLAVAQQQGIRSVLINARLSERSRAKYARFAGGVRAMMQCLSALGAQTQADLDRLLSLGANPETSHVLGNLKYDLQLPADLTDRATPLREMYGKRPVLICGSTHDGEEQLILSAFKTIQADVPDALLVLVPRHPERFDRVAKLIEQVGFSFARRAAGETVSPDTAVYLADTMGEMMCLYAASDIAFVGGSLIERGGHNLLEPAALGLPCLSGPHTFNFVEVNALLDAAEGLAVVHDATAFAREVIGLMTDTTKRETMGQAALGVVLANKGALDRYLALSLDKVSGLEVEGLGGVASSGVPVEEGAKNHDQVLVDNEQQDEVARADAK